MSMNPFRYGSVVEGENFCPRPALETQIRQYAESGQNLVVQGARRMGKTSLLKHAVGGIRGMRLVYVDLYFIKTPSDFCARVMKGVSAASADLPFLSRALQLAFRLRPTLSVSPADGTPTISVDARAAADPDSVGATMEALSKIAEGGRTCIVFDEFQDILHLNGSDRILAEMRGTIQFQGTVPYFFTGSSRNAMMDIFDGMDSPFYKSALPLEVGEIDPPSFTRFLIARFRKGDRRISAETVAKILEFADSVPGDAQELCEALWSTTAPGAQITEADFPAALGLVFSREIRGYEAVLEKLTPAQSTVLRSLAANGRERLASADFAARTGLAASSAKRAVGRLLADRIVFSRAGECRFSNPFFREWLLRNA